MGTRFDRRESPSVVIVFVEGDTLWTETRMTDKRMFVFEMDSKAFASQKRSADDVAWCFFNDFNRKG